MNDDDIKTNGEWLNESDDNYESCKQLLLASLPSGYNNITGLHIWKIDSDDISTRFDKRSFDMNKVLCFVSSKDLTFDNSIQSVIQNGYSFKHTNGKMMFSTGIIDDNLLSLQVNAELTYILTEVAIGKPYVCDDISKNISIPNGYDSYYIPNLPLDRNKDGEFSLAEYRAAACFDNRDPSQYSHKYIVLDPNQACPRYLIKFTLNVYTPDLYKDLLYEDVEYFDPILFKHVSAKEKKVASTSRLLIPVQHAYEQAVKSILLLKHEKELFKTNDPLSDGKNKWIDKQFDLIDERIRLINLNYAEETEKLTEAFKDATEKLKNITKEKLEIILSAEIELRRDEEQMAWVDSYIKKQRSDIIDRLESNSLSGAKKNMARINFLKSLHYYTNFRNNWCKLKNTQRNVLDTVSPEVDAVIDVKFIPRKNKNDLSEVVDDKSTLNHSSVASVKNISKDLSIFIKNSNITPTYKKKNALAYPQVPLNSSLKKLIDLKANQIKEAVAAAASNKIFPLPPSLMQEFGIIPSSSGIQYPVPLPYNFSGGESKNDLKKLNVRNDYESQLLNIVGSSPNYDAESDATSIMSESTFSRKTPQKFKSPGGSVRGGSIRGDSSNYNKSTSRGKIETLGVTVTPAKQKRNLSISSLQQLTVSYKKFSLEVVAIRKMSQLKTQTNISNLSGLLSLQGSTILSKKDSENIYFNLPFFSKVPDCSLLYSTAIHKRGLEEMYVRCMKHNGATFFIIRSGQFKFGGYLNQSISLSNGWTGSASCFLYSLTLDLKIPYQSKLQGGEMKVYFGEWEKVSIGDGDLILNQSLEYGSSHIENSFGIGLNKTDSQCLCLLAGAGEFTIDALECWAIS